MAYLFNLRTRKTEEVPESEVENAVRSGSHEFGASNKVQVVNPEGVFGTIDALEAKDALNSGYKLAGQAERQAFTTGQQEKEVRKIAGEYGGTEAAIAALDAISLGGLSALANTKYDDYAKYRNILREENPWASAAGTLAGTVGSMFTTPGAALLKLGAKAGATVAAKTGITKAVGGLTAKAAAEGAGVGTRLAATGGQLGERVVKGAVENAFTGMVGGFGQGVTEAALGKPEEVAENILYGVGMGGLFGGAIGGGIPVLSKVVSGGVQAGLKAADLAATKVAGTLAKTRLDTAGRAAFDRLAKSPTLTKDISAASREEVKKASQDAKRFVISEIDRIQAEMKSAVNTDEVVDLANVVKENVDSVYANVKNQHRLTANAFKEENPTAMGNRLSSAAREVRKTITKLGGKGENTAAKELAFGLAKTVQVAKKAPMGLKKISDPTKSAGFKEAFKDELVDEVHSPLLNTKTLSKKDDSLLHVGEINAADDIEGLRTIRSTIDDLIYSKKAPLPPSEISRLQALRNKIDGEIKSYGYGLGEKYAATDLKINQFNKKIKEPFAKTTQKKNQATDKYYVNREKIEKAITKDSGQAASDLSAMLDDYKAALAGMEETEGVLSKEAIDGFQRIIDANIDYQARVAPLATQREAIEAIKKGPGSVLDKAIRIREILGGGKQTFEDALPLAKVLDDYKTVKANDTSLVTGGVGLGTIGTAGAILGVPMGATIATGALVAPILAPSKVLNIISTVRGISQKASSGLDSGIYNMVNKVTSRTNPAYVKSNITPKNKEEWKKDYKKFSSYLEPTEAAKAASTATEGLSELPMVRQATQQSFIMALSHLANTLPKPINNPSDSITPQLEDPRVKESDKVAWYKRMEVASNPSEFVTKISNGYIPVREEIDTFKTLFPGVYGKLTTAVQQAVLESKSPISFSKRQQLSRLFGTSVDIQTDPKYTKSLQKAAYPPPEENKSGGGSVGSGNIAKRLGDLNETQIGRVMS